MSKSEGLSPTPSRRSHVAMSVIGSVVMAFFVRLSAGDRGPVDWVVIGLVGGVVLWQLWCLGRRLHAHGGASALGHEGRAVALWLVGLMNTVWAVPGSEGTWKWWVGTAMLVLAAADTIALFIKERRMLTPDGATSG